MKILALRNDLITKLKRAGIYKKFLKQKKFFELDYRYPSLHTEKLEPWKLGLYSLRIDKKWRAIFIFLKKDIVEIVDINLHYHYND